VLAGGLARRMGGGDKPLIRVGARTILERVVSSLAPQRASLIVNIHINININANGDQARFVLHAPRFVADEVPGFAGPLACAHFGPWRHRTVGLWRVQLPATCAGQ
jgi:molybdopterin-guanine dinucleotide biosynthesis protein A